MKTLKLNDIFETERLIIRLLDISEAQAFYEIIDESTHRFMSWEEPKDYKIIEKNIIKTIWACKAWENWRWALFLKDWTIIGRFWIHTINIELKNAYLEYWLATEHWWKGYISECVDWIKEYGFTEMWLDKITIRCVKENIWSAKVAEKAWFTLDWIIRHDDLQKWKYVDNKYYSFLKEDFRK